MVSAGLQVVQVAGRDRQKTDELAAELGAHAAYSPYKIDPSAHLVLLAVSDKAIAEVATQLPSFQGVWVHTAGSVSKNILQPFARQYGVLYPLQSLLKDHPTHDPIPFLVDGNSSESLSVIQELAFCLSSTVETCGDEARAHFHLAAVFANNFVNHLLGIGQALCSEQQLNSALLHPLILETARRATQTGNPWLVQTGPALRSDGETLNRHQDLLQRHPAWQNVYQTITRSIQQTHQAPPKCFVK
jgi:predicted short-subunit dehydrogenase-like oxidoreductase (DUF2520 family)